MRALLARTGERGIARLDGQNVRRDRVAEERRLALGCRERDVRAVEHAARAVIHGPAQVVGDLRLVRTSRQRRRRERVDTIAVGVLHPGSETVGLPVARASSLRLEVAGYHDDVALRRVLEELGTRVEVESDGSTGCGVGDVGAARHAPGTVVHIPGSVERDLVLVDAGRDVECAGVDAVGPLRQLRRFAAGLPVARATHLGVVATGNRDEVDAGFGIDGLGEVDGVAHRGVGRGGSAVARSIRRDRPILEQRSLRQARGVVEYARRRIFGGTQHRPVGRPGDPPGKTRLLPDIVGDIRAHGADPGDPGTGDRHIDGESSGGCGRYDLTVGDEHDGAECGNREGDRTIDVGGSRGSRGAVEHGIRRTRGEGGQRDRFVGGRVIDSDEVLDLLGAINAAEGIHARAGVGVALDLSALREGRMPAAQCRECADVLVQRRIRIESIDRSRDLTRDERLGGVLLDLGREHVLAGGLIVTASGSGEALLVSVVDHRLATGEVHQFVGEFVALHGRAAVLQKVSDAPHVVVAEECGQRCSVRIGRRVEVVAREQRAEPLRAVASREVGCL